MFREANRFAESKDPFFSVDPPSRSDFPTTPELECLAIALFVPARRDPSAAWKLRFAEISTQLRMTELKT
jgi:hypothetical protein